MQCAFAVMFAANAYVRHHAGTPSLNIAVQVWQAIQTCSGLTTACSCSTTAVLNARDDTIKHLIGFHVVVHIQQSTLTDSNRKDFEMI